jgi:chromosome segregation ATPase
MTTSIKWGVGGVSGLIFTLILAAIFYPEKTAEAKQSVEAAGSVAVDKVISAMEERVGKADVALEHYKTAQKQMRDSLVQLKTLQRDCERKASAAALQAAQLRSAGNEAGAAAQDAQKAMYDKQLVSLNESVTKTENKYKEFNTFLKNKKMELDMLKARTGTLKSELVAMNGGDAAYALQRARELEEEVKSTCSRLEAEMDVLKLDEETAN